MIYLAEVGPYAWLIHLLAVALLIWAAVTTNWKALRVHPGTHHFMFGAVLVLSGFWVLKAGVHDGLHFHILGIAAITLLMGWRLALLVYAGVLAVMVLVGQIGLQDWSVSFLLGVGLPVLVCYQFYLQVYRRLPHNPFVYILVAGFLNAALSQVVFVSSVSFWYWITEYHAPHLIWNDYLSYLILTLFPEGVTNGMFISGMVTFQPRWLSTFDEDSYFGS
ncbi:MAG TPA: hypothetical protein DEA26_06500 [Oceanospirillales bacterium]|nr:hypothetical protein [Oceanospirillaceae bacterium]HBS42311.1 hypothetical protein [Oceanospirillales bacterium]|tara:strand:- start:2890 stop:3549 length:660 start_codon:yes stop_codon:yes gene_type:complete